MIYMQYLKFKSPQDMLEHILTNNDLYNTHTGEYVFAYNDKNAIAVYMLSEKTAHELDIQTKQPNNDHYWANYLGTGGKIYDEPYNIHWCINGYASDYWIHTKDFNKYYSQKEVKT